MTRPNDQRIGRRPVLKSAGIGIVGLGGLASPAAARKTKKGRGKGRNRGEDEDKGRSGERGKRPLESSPSLVATMAFSSELPPELPPFGYPIAPVLKTFDPGVLFNTTSAEINPSGQVIHYQLQFGADSKPYVLTHADDGHYLSRGSVINFELAEPDPMLGLAAGKYRATVRDRVQLYEKGGYFDWSVTRTDIFNRPGMDYVHSSLIIVWDEDGPRNQDPTYRNTPNPADPDDEPEYSPSVLEDSYNAIHHAATELIDAGPSNPGGR